MNRQPHHFTDANFEADVLQNERPVLVDFWAGWCGPCRLLSPTIDTLAAEHDAALIGKLDVDANPRTAQAFGVQSIPTVLLFHQGKLVERLVGVQPIQAYEEALARVASGVA